MFLCLVLEETLSSAFYGMQCFLQDPYISLREIPFYSYFTKKLYQLFIQILKLLQANSPLIC